MGTYATKVVKNLSNKSSQKLSVLNCVPYVPSCLACPRALRALVPYMPSCLTCPRALRTLALCVPSRLHAMCILHALRTLVPYLPYVPCMPSCLTYIKVYLVGCFWNSRINCTKSCFGCWFFLIWTTQKVHRESTKGRKVPGKYRWRSSFFSKVSSFKPATLLKMNLILRISLQLHFFFQQFTFL